jgi:hypothetical protein
MQTAQEANRRLARALLDFGQTIDPKEIFP